MKQIIQFYTRAQAFEQLSGFYDSCAQVEIDEYRDYNKALGAMREAMKHLQSSEASNKSEKVTLLENRINMVERFVQARQASDMAVQLDQLLQTPEIETAIRMGDIFAQLVEYHYENKDMDNAYKYLEQMKGRKIVITPYLDMEMVENIYRAMGINPSQEISGTDDIEEDIPEDF